MGQGAFDHRGGLVDAMRLEDRSRFIAVMQGGIVKAGELAR